MFSHQSSHSVCVLDLTCAFLSNIWWFAGALWVPYYVHLMFLISVNQQNGVHESGWDKKLHSFLPLFVKVHKPMFIIRMSHWCHTLVEGAEFWSWLIFKQTFWPYKLIFVIRILQEFRKSIVRWQKHWLLSHQRNKIHLFWPQSQFKVVLHIKYLCLEWKRVSGSYK